ncbi:regulator [Streptomyces sp. NBC_00986]|uniref:regulator n=1 Tax=Streptomyces sp. NBC_00986 TaxID=2903702 RepID=UPI00386D0E86|nr:regulator [Streptomyces sp. NBC_00986]
MLRIHLSTDDLARIRFAPHPAPLYELNAALMMLYRKDSDPLSARWRQRVRRSLPGSSRPLRNLVSGLRCPEFVIVSSATVAEGQGVARSSSPGLIRSGIEMMYPAGTHTAPQWIRDPRKKREWDAQ